MTYSSGVVFALICVALTLAQIQTAYSQHAQDKAQRSTNKDGRLFNETGYVRGLTPARVIGLVELFLGILSVVYAVRSRRHTSAPLAKTGLALGIGTVTMSVVHVAVASGAVFGSGSGKAGSILALILGTTGLTIGWWSLRSRHKRA